jgi:hypothetical protein
MFAGPSRAKFEQKLAADVQLISRRADVIGFQEVAPFWHKFIREILVNWTSASLLTDGIDTFVSPSWTVASVPQAILLFPLETSMQRKWRKWFQA